MAFTFLLKFHRAVLNIDINRLAKVPKAYKKKGPACFKNEDYNRKKLSLNEEKCAFKALKNENTVGPR